MFPRNPILMACFLAVFGLVWLVAGFKFVSDGEYRHGRRGVEPKAVITKTGDPQAFYGVASFIFVVGVLCEVGVYLCVRDILKARRRAADRSD